MKTTISIMLVLILPLVSCNENKPTDNQEIKIINSGIIDNSYFPLAVGNEWVYQVSLDTVKYYIKIIDKKIINNNEYFVILFTPEMGGHFFKDGKALIRTTSDGLKLMIYDDGAEKLYRDFSDTITDSSYSSEFTTQNIAFVDLPMGRFNDCKVISDDKIRSVPSEPSFWFYAKGIGLINYGWFRGHYNLISAKINNRNY